MCSVQAVSNALGATVDCAPHRSWPGGFTGLYGKAQTMLAGIAINLAKELRRATPLVAANTKANNAFALPAVMHSLFHNKLRSIGTEMAHGIKDPEQR